MAIESKHDRDGYWITHRISGPVAEVEAEIARIEREFPPAGYGTRTRAIDDLGDGRIRAEVLHCNSCD